MQSIAPYIFEEIEIHDSIKKQIVPFKHMDDFNFVDIYKCAWTLNEEKNICPLLASIDPYDNTIFNYNQCEELLLEIENINESCRSITNLENIKNLIKSIERGKYLLLMGD